MTKREPNPAVVEWLQQRGFTPPEIAKVLDRMAQYDQKTQSDSVFDSIGNNSLTLDAIIREALEETTPGEQALGEKT